MARSPLRFRCYRCNKLLGVSASKAGRVVTCPSCAADLIVPDLPPELDAGVNVGSETTPEVETLPEFVRAAAADGVVAEDRIDLTRLDLRIESAGGGEQSKIPSTPPAGPIPGDEPTLILTEPTPSRPVFPIEPPSDFRSRDAGDAELAALAFIAPSGDSDGRSPQGTELLDRSARGRAGDIVVPRSVAIAWSLLALSAVAGAFASGLLLGRFVWRTG
ncbi:MAG: hypothetical protein SFX72_20910 [Isosphaeraceae bacterium]|nr:hypothetical protein [Isosphaeraceae bacterium]